MLLNKQDPLLLDKVYKFHHSATEKETDKWEICRISGRFLFKGLQLEPCAFVMALLQHDGK